MHRATLTKGIALCERCTMHPFFAKVIPVTGHIAPALCSPYYENRNLFVSLALPLFAPAAGRHAEFEERR
mgnify:FL=1